jgi:Activator of Hsp90 ATPase homolog 1-like protein
MACLLPRALDDSPRSPRRPPRPTEEDMTDATLLTDRGRHAVRLERHLVGWRALTEREQLRSWFPCDVIVEGGRWEVGAAIMFPFSPEALDLTLTGDVLEVDEPNVLAFTWGRRHAALRALAGGRRNATCPRRRAAAGRGSPQRGRLGELPRPSCRPRPCPRRMAGAFRAVRRRVRARPRPAETKTCLSLTEHTGPVQARQQARRRWARRR